MSKKLRFSVLGKTSANFCCLKLAPSHTLQLSFYFKLARIVKNLKLVQETVRNCPVLGESSAKERAQLYCCLKLALNHTWQLSFCFRLARIVKNVKLVQETVRNGPVA